MIELLDLPTLLLGLAPPAAEENASGFAAMQVQSVWDFISKGGIMMIPIGICSLIGLAVFIERMISLRRENVIPSKFLPGLKKTLSEGANKAKALDYCAKHPSPVSRVFAVGIKRLGAPLEVVERHIQEAGQREVLKLRRFVRALALIASVTPLLGLLGTILGMIKSFQTVAMSAEALGRTEMLAGGIYEAMITTAAGLSVAIPFLIAFHYINSKIERLVIDIDQQSVDFIEKYAVSADKAMSHVHVAGAKTPAKANGEMREKPPAPAPQAASSQGGAR